MTTIRKTLSLCLPSLALALAACGDDGGGGGEAGSGSSGSSGGMTSAPTTTATTTTTAGTTTAGTGMGTTTMGGSTGAMGDLVAFRVSQLDVRDPHFFFPVPVFGCTDLTDMAPLGNDGVNAQLNAGITMDGDMPADGILDLSLMLVFDPLDQGNPGMMGFTSADCTDPVATTMCMPRMDAMEDTSMYTPMAMGDCQSPTMADLSPAGYTPLPGTTTGPCFVTDPFDLSLELGLFALPLSDATIAGQFNGDPASGLMEGTLRGFLSVADAEAAVLPDSVTLLGGSPIADLLPGHMNNCAPHDDMDDNGGTMGWWMYADFQAAVAPWTP